MSSLWAIILIGGPLLLLAAFIYSWLQNRNMPEAQKMKSDRAVRELREEIASEPNKRIDL